MFLEKVMSEQKLGASQGIKLSKKHPRQRDRLVPNSSGWAQGMSQEMKGGWAGYRGARNIINAHLYTGSAIIITPTARSCYVKY